MSNIAKNTVCLWYDRDAEEAARFYSKTFPGSAVGAVHRAPGDNPSGKQGEVLTVEFSVMGIPCLGINGGPVFKHTEAFSFQVATEDQAETDRYWEAIVGNGGQESQCGWCKDKWGISWQITPRALTQAFTGADRAAARRAFDAMMTMKKIDIAAIEAAVRGSSMEHPAPITVSVVVPCSPLQAWHAFTDPVAVKSWNFASADWHCPDARNDLRPGGQFSYRMAARDGSMGFDYEGRFTEVTPHSRIRFTLGPDRDVLVQFAAGDQGTKVSQTFTPETTFSIEQQRSGWQAIMDNYRQHVSDTVQGGPSRVG